MDKVAAETALNAMLIRHGGNAVAASASLNRFAGKAAKSVDRPRASSTTFLTGASRLAEAARAGQGLARAQQMTTGLNAPG
ncbi:hypothetical protein [Dongia sp.]|uniref:hypothetical protein n=1 Tax=Dongia sp. TaxID=1977262 RepID=UPI003753D44C